MGAPQRIGNYQLLKKLATGGMAEVWLANQLGIEGFNRHIVVKRILPHLSEDPEFVQMFLNEAKIASRFSHPNIAQIYDLGQGGSDGQYFIAMEFIHGEDLGRLMRKAWSTGQWIARPLAIRIVAEACKGLFYAHTRNDDQGRPLRVVHRDISPQNILISFDGSVKLVDFGIAKAADQASMTKSGAIKGKFAYMAPEQAGGKPLDARTDLFALGLVLYELLTGVRPLKRDSELATLQAALECAIDPPSVVAEVPAELDDVVMRALAKAPDDRYRDASMFQMALEEFLIGQRLVATSVQISELMETLFADRRAEEEKLGAPNPAAQGDSQHSLPAMPEMPAPKRGRKQSDATPPPDEDFVGTDRATPGESTSAGAPEDWEAPPAAPVGPSRRYANRTAPQRAHSSSGPELTRQKPATREFEEPELSESSAPAPRKSRLNVKRPSNGANGEAQVAAREASPDATLPPDAPAPRRTSSSAKVKRTSSGEMPDAPPRRSRDSLAPLDDDEPKTIDAAANATNQKKMKRAKSGDKAEQGESKSAIDLTGMRRRQAQRRGVVVIGLLIISLGILALIFKQQKQTFASNEVPISLTITTNPPTRVYVKHGGTLTQTPLDLGMTPIEEARGAVVGDTVWLNNDAMCLSYEESIQFGQINDVRKIERTFVQKDLTVNTKPPLKGIGIYCNGQKIGTTGMKVFVYEGPHAFELRDERFNQAVPFEAQVSAKGTNTVTVPVEDALKK